MNRLIEYIINELTYNDLMRKQRSIGRLFPPFGARVDAVAQAGGANLREQLPEYWHFEVPSGTKSGIKYDVYVRFKNLEEMIKKFASDRRLWNKDETFVDYRLIAAEILNNVDVETMCSCPADLYWGGQYIRTQRDAKFTNPENRPPDIRNPRQYGCFCKHSQNVFNVLPMYTSTFASYLKKFWNDEVTNAVELTKEEYGLVKVAAAELGKREEERPVSYTRGGKEVPTAEEPGEELDIETPEEEIPPEKIEGPELKKTIGRATKPATRKPGPEEPEEKPEDQGKKGKYKTKG